MTTRLKVGDYVKVSEIDQIGKIEVLPSKAPDYAVIYFGIMDGKSVVKRYLLSSLEKIERPSQPEEVVRRQLEESGMPYKEITEEPTRTQDLTPDAQDDKIPEQSTEENL